MKRQIDVLVVRTDGSSEIMSIDNGDLRKLQELVGGYIETIAGPGWVAFCNEEGKLMRLPLNSTATRFAVAHGWQRGVDVLVGDVVFTGPADANGDTTAVPDKLKEL